MLAEVGVAEGGGCVSPEFDLPSASESEHDDAPPQKRQKPSRKTREDPNSPESRPMALVDEEALALALTSLSSLRRLVFLVNWNIDADSVE
jgi:hypothetical protein